MLHEELVRRGCELVLGPYGSDTTRAVARLRAGAVVWNHGAAADDVQRMPGVVSVSTPASRYLVALAKAVGRTRVAVLAAPGRFAALAREGLEREAPTLGIELVEPGEAEAVLVCGPVEWEAERLREWTGRRRVVGGVSPGLPHRPWPDGTLAAVQWHPDLWGPPGVEDYVAAQAYAAAAIAEHCLELDPDDPLGVARGLRTRTFFGEFELADDGLQIGHKLAVVSWHGGTQKLVQLDAA